MDLAQFIARMITQGALNKIEKNRDHEESSNKTQPESSHYGVVSGNEHHVRNINIRLHIHAKGSEESKGMYEAEEKVYDRFWRANS